MMRSVLLALCLMGNHAGATPIPQNSSNPIADVINQLNAATDSSNPSSASNILETLKSITPQSSPASVEEAYSRLRSTFQQSPQPANLWSSAARLVASGLTMNNVERAISLNIAGTSFTGPNSLDNSNSREPETSIFPRAGGQDAPYSLTEDQLRAAIFIPDTFGNAGDGRKPTILVPGTGNTGYQTFRGNMIPLLQGSDMADPVWLNIPQQLLGDIQVNAEYVAYAINYISGITKGHVNVVSWSQGGINTQWALKYWPSTRSLVDDFVAFSPDYHGTKLANLINIGEPLSPAVLQQEYDSSFVTTLRADGGDSAYVPTTTVYSAFFDEIVEPQQDPNASAFIEDSRNVGTSNNQVQSVCHGQPAGGFYLHEGTLYNNLGFALLKDAFTHDGPGSRDRLDLNSVCGASITNGLDLDDFLYSEEAILIAGLSVLTLQGGPAFIEPELMDYARNAPAETPKTPAASSTSAPSSYPSAPGYQ